MSKDISGENNNNLQARQPILGRMVLPAMVVVLIVFSLYLLNISRQPNPSGTIHSITQQQPSQATQRISAQGTKVTFAIDTEIGVLRAEFYPDKAPAVVAELVALAKSGYFTSNTVLEVRPGMGFVIAKMGKGAKKFNVADEPTGLSSQRGSIAISKSSESVAYLNNLFFGFGALPELEKHYTVIGQVLDGLERFESSGPGVLHKIIGFKQEYDKPKEAALSSGRGAGT